MVSLLEELVGFLHSKNPEARKTATEHLAGYSRTQPAIFKSNKFAPIGDLKILVQDRALISKNAITILINLSGNGDLEFLQKLAADDQFLRIVLNGICNPKEPNANSLAMLLANLSKHASMERLVNLEREKPVPSLPTQTKRTITQLVEIYNLGASFNPAADFDHLGYVFADLAKYPAFLTHLTTPPPSSPLDPLTTFLPMTTHPSPLRRLGTALLLRNLVLSPTSDPLYLIQPAHSILPPVLLPLCSANQASISEEEMDQLPEVCQYLPPEHQQEQDVKVVRLLVEVLYLLAARSGGQGRDVMREGGVYVVVREVHLEYAEREGEAAEGVRGWCEKVVDLLMGDEGDGKAVGEGGKREGGVDGGKVIGEVEEENNEDDEIVPIF